VASRISTAPGTADSTSVVADRPIGKASSVAADTAIGAPSADARQPEKPAAAADARVLYEDNFADLTGSIHWNRDGKKSWETAPNERTVYFFSAPAENGSLTMKVVEDNETSGPDEQPGVLALSWPELPEKLPWSGFVYLGRKGNQRLELPPLQQAKAADDLKKFKLTFRYKAANKNREKPISLQFGIRLEPMLADSYNKRLDFGAIDATDKWETFTAGFEAGKNSDAFLKTIAEEKPVAFKIIWAQWGTRASYQAGDTLLIDDLKIETVEIVAP
jgi:hypothetical protein